MANDDDFEPRLGRQRGTGGKKPASYATRVALAAGLNAAGRGKGSRRFDGSRIGRGAAVGRLLSTRDRLSGYRARRVVVKTRLVRLAAKGLGAARAHLHYIQRDGVTREGNPGELYGPAADRADGGDFLDRCKDDRHQFRFIVSAEDGDQYGDLKPFVRRLMTQVEEDLGTKLDWVAVDHHNTGHPHTHIVLRGVDERGQNLVIAREYIAHGFRQRASEQMTLELGPRMTHEIEARTRLEIDAERLTGLDRRLLGRMDGDRCVSPTGRDPFFQALETGRLQTLRRMKLVEDLAEGRWRLAPGLEDTLRSMGERGDIIRLMQREVTRARLERTEQRIYGPASEPLVGRVIMRGLADEHRDRHFLLVDGIDGRSHYVGVGEAAAVEELPKNAVVRLAPRIPMVRDMDRTVQTIADVSDGRYSTVHHQLYDPTASRAFAESHVRRLEAMRKAGFDVGRDPDGSWRISPDHLALAERFEQKLARERPVEVEVVAIGSLDYLAAADGATWLDRELASPSGMHVRDAGFGREVRSAMSLRRQWLVDQELAVETSGSIRLRQGALALLQRRELLRIAARLSGEMGKEFSEAKQGDLIEGRIVRRIEGVSGRFALVEKSRDFTLVPWRPVLEKQIGKQVEGIMRETGINWRFGRGRSGPEIS